MSDANRAREMVRLLGWTRVNYTSGARYARLPSGLEGVDIVAFGSRGHDHVGVSAYDPTARARLEAHAAVWERLGFERQTGADSRHATTYCGCFPRPDDGGLDPRIGRELQRVRMELAKLK
ncbi:MAG: hypothetical protein AB7P02_22400 [Alphaproteobacteria bacterium]